MLAGDENKEEGNDHHHNNRLPSAKPSTSVAAGNGPTLRTADAAYLASASSLSPPILSRTSTQASAGQASPSQGKAQKASPTVVVDLTESCSSLSPLRAHHPSPSPGRPRSLMSTTATEEDIEDSVRGAIDGDGGVVTAEAGDEDGPSSSSSSMKQRLASAAPTPRTDFLTQRLRSAIGEDIVLHKDHMDDDRVEDSGGVQGETEGTESLEGTGSGTRGVVAEQGNPIGSSWGWSTITNLPSSLRVEAALNSLRGVSNPSSSGANEETIKGKRQTSKGDEPSLQGEASGSASTSAATNITASEGLQSFGSYMKPLDVRRWWSSNPASAAGGNSSRSTSSERPSVSSRSNSIRGGLAGGGDDAQSVKSIDSSSNSKPLQDKHPLKGLTPGSFPASSIAKKNKKKQEQLEREAKGKDKKLDEGGKVERGRGEGEMVEHDLSDHVFGLEEGDERFPEREYLVLSTAGKPIYVSYVSKARLKRAAEAKERRLRRRADGRRTQGGSEAEEAILTTEDQALQDDEDQKAATKVGVLQALVSNYETLGSKELQQRSLDILDMPRGTRICYLLRPPLYLVAVSQWGEEESTLRNHLDQLYLAIISLVSASKLSKLFDRAANFDLKRLLEGTDAILDTLLTGLQLDATSLYGALQPLRIDTALRLDVGSALIPSKESARPQDALYALLLTQGGIVTLARRKRRSIHPVDCHLLINTVYATKAMKEVGTQSWVPICLPKFAPQGFLYAHVSFLDEEERERERENNEDGISGRKDEDRPELALVLVTSNPDGFEEMSKWRSSIIGSLHNQDLLTNLTRAVELGRATYSADELRLPGLRHFLFKWRSNVQSTSPQFEDPYSVDGPNQKRLICLYGMAYHYIHSKANGGGEEGEEEDAAQAATTATMPSSPIIRPKSVLAATPTANPSTTPQSSTTTKAKKKSIPIGQHILRTSSEIVFAWSTHPFELYLTVSPHLPKSAIINIAKSVVRWVKQEEHRLFIVSAPVF